MNKGRQKTDTWKLSGNDYDDYYEQIHDDAFSGDLDAQAEMHEEFGDDWKENIKDTTCIFDCFSKCHDSKRSRAFFAWAA